MDYDGETMAQENVRPLLPGDELVLDVEIEHEMNLAEVRVTLVHTESTGVRRRLIDDQAILREEHPTAHGNVLKTSEVNFRETITGDWMPGEYKCAIVEFVTSGGRLITLTKESNPINDVGYVIGSEPESTPKITNFNMPPS